VLVAPADEARLRSDDVIDAIAAATDDALDEIEPLREFPRRSRTILQARW
jgi:hypothetical protein